ncbi:NAD(P)-binding protein [Wolfiporia cocos MD-104 SS10]|uniref:NAD(P)-binding protein n=1 Tax=Wolfiporia cocos (strain MD-104) TaxID=742152 RepID=A0A2H3JSL6_WOLCO|nr:NAD(P)-binding protein [Wolfiporia cocos MD-104 SS10]
MGLNSSKPFDPDTLPELSGKVVVVTGGAAGVGFAVVQQLARRGAKVYVAARDQPRADKAIERLRASGLGPGNGNIEYLYLDLDDPRTAKKSAEDFMQKEERLDVLGELNVCRRDAVISMLTLLPLLKRTANEPNSDVRIVIVSTDGFDAIRHPVQFKSTADFNLEYRSSIFPWPSLMRYCYSKYIVMLYASEQQRRLDDEGVPIIVMTTHPGAINSATLSPYIASIARAFVNAVFTTPTRGAYSTVFAAASDEVRAEPRMYRGAYVRPPNQCTLPPERVRDRKKAQELWALTENVLSELGVTV